MARGLLYAVIAAGALALAACSEHEPDSTTGPQLAGGANNDPCAFSNSLVTSYFPSSRQARATNLKQSMANAGHGTEGARNYGFELMDSIGSVSRSFGVSASAGAELTLAVIGCMFANASSFTYPTNAVADFTKALASADGGAYYVRGGGREGTVLGRRTSPGGADGNLSGIEPSTSSWSGVLPQNVAEGRVLFYGYPVPGTNPLLYEWATIPSALTYVQPLVVAVCDNETPSGTAMLNVEAVGVVAYANTFICDTQNQPQSMIDAGWGPKALFARLGRAVVNALTPEPLQALALVTSTGGKTSTLPKSKIGKQSVSTLSLDWDTPPGVKPPANIIGTYPSKTVPIRVTVSAPASGDYPVSAVFGACAYLTGTNNNGTPTQLTSTANQDLTNCTNPPGGNQDAIRVQLTAIPGNTAASLADFGQVGVTKTGGIIFMVTVDVLGRDGAGSKFTKSNVKPAK